MKFQMAREYIETRFIGNILATTLIYCNDLQPHSL